jgi:hypothetical protein
MDHWVEDILIWTKVLPGIVSIMKYYNEISVEDEHMVRWKGVSAVKDFCGMLIVVMFLWGYSSQSLAQPNDRAQNTVYFELFGNDMENKE